MEKLGVSSAAFPTLVLIFPFSRVSFYKIKELRWQSNGKLYTAISLVRVYVYMPLHYFFATLLVVCDGGPATQSIVR